MRIGIPRALLYYNFYPALSRLLEATKAEIVISSETNKQKLEQGLTLCEDEVCLPVKVLMGHVMTLAEQNVDGLFMPRMISLERSRYICPKFLGLPDMVRSSLGKDIQVLSPTVNLSWGKLRMFREGLKSAGPWLRHPLALWRSFRAAESEQLAHQQQLAAAFAQPQGTSKRVAVLGHAYNIFDGYINYDLLKNLQTMGVETLTVENFSRAAIEEGARDLSKDLFWSYGRDIVGAAFYCLRRRAVDGVIIVASFGCGPDSLITEIIERRFSQAGIPLMSIVLDEHSSGTGLITRLEAFTDMLHWRDAN
ncbi:MAG: hypothetical protein FH749_05020 [Firmicutes bacterium]|nr:hypothetical protein [Bacillota bacterium]